MKRVLLFAVSLLLVFASAAASAPVDLSALDDAALLALLDSIQAEYISRLSFSSFVVEKGDYRVGVDVPAGAFRVEIAGSGNISDVKVKNENGLTVFFAQVFGPGWSGSAAPEDRSIGRLLLEDGFSLSVTSGPVRFFAVPAGVTFFP